MVGPWYPSKSGSVSFSVPCRQLCQLMHLRPIPLPEGHFKVSIFFFNLFCVTIITIYFARVLENLALVSFSVSPPWCLTFSLICTRIWFVCNSEIMKPNCLIHHSLVMGDLQKIYILTYCCCCHIYHDVRSSTSFELNHIKTELILNQLFTFLNTLTTSDSPII